MWQLLLPSVREPRCNTKEREEKKEQTLSLNNRTPTKQCNYIYSESDQTYHYRKRTECITRKIYTEYQEQSSLSCKNTISKNTRQKVGPSDSSLKLWHSASGTSPPAARLRSQDCLLRRRRGSSRTKETKTNNTEQETQRQTEHRYNQGPNNSCLYFYYAWKSLTDSLKWFCNTYSIMAE